jgi:hypothetical protein
MRPPPAAPGRAASPPAGPLGKLEPRRREHLAKARVLELARVAEAVEIEVRHRPARQRIRLHHRIGGTLDAALHAQGAQQVAHEGGLARAQRAAQLHIGIAQRRQRGQPLGEGPAGDFVGPGGVAGS